MGELYPKFIRKPTEDYFAAKRDIRLKGFQMRTITKEQLTEILEKHKLWLKDKTTGKKADLSGADLSGVNLSYADLRGADLSKADLSGADLIGANLVSADLRGADLRGADLSGADLSGADLSYADLRGADLSKTYLCGANLDFSSLPLWCGSFDIKVDRKIASQLAYHFCKMVCDDEEVKLAQNSLIDLANNFHRVEECGKINKI